MVLCKYFTQGNCRFGSKCNNEHFDVKVLVKTDVESALKGKQWPFSCYGPFKDKPNIPNFIEDQSFEEVRFLSYEARKKGNFDEFHKQFTKEAVEANTKMRALLQLSPEVVDVVIKVYDTPTESVSISTSSNLYNLGTNAGNANAIFGKLPDTVTSGNPFDKGGLSAASGSASSIFGGSVNETKNNIFTGSNTTLFGSTSGQQNASFGQWASKPTNPFFGSNSNSTQSSIFAQTQNAGVISNASFSQTAQQTHHMSPTYGSLFAPPVQQQTSPSSGFATFSQSPLQGTSPFSQQQHFGQVVPPSNSHTQTSGLFAQVTPAAAGANIFGQTTQPQSIMNPGNFVATMSQSQNAFGNVTGQTQSTAATVGQFTDAPQQFLPPVGFHTQNSQLAEFKQQPLVLAQERPQSVSVTASTRRVVFDDTGIYSSMESLTADEIEAFKADKFSANNVPNVPPPREFVN